MFGLSNFKSRRLVVGEKNFFLKTGLTKFGFSDSGHDEWAKLKTKTMEKQTPKITRWTATRRLSFSRTYRTQHAALRDHRGTALGYRATASQCRRRAPPPPLLNLTLTSNPRRPIGRLGACRTRPIVRTAPSGFGGQIRFRWFRATCIAVAATDANWPRFAVSVTRGTGRA